jgi:uncharacterized membrane protein
MAIVIVLLFPEQIKAISAKAQKETLKTFLLGILGKLLIIPLIILLIISIIGILFIPLFGLIFVLALFAGYVAIASLVGRTLVKGINKPDMGLVLNTIIGLVLFYLLGLIPFVGWLVKLIVLIFGFGAIINLVFIKTKTVRKTRKK